MVAPFPTERLDALCLCGRSLRRDIRRKRGARRGAPWVGVNALDALTISQVAIVSCDSSCVRAISSTDSLEVARPRTHSSESRDGTFHGPIAHERSVGRVARSDNACFRGRELSRPAPRFVSKRSGALFADGVDPDICRTTWSPPKHLGRSFTLDDEGVDRRRSSTDMATSLVSSIHPMLMIPHQRRRESSNPSSLRRASRPKPIAGARRSDRPRSHGDGVANDEKLPRD